MKRLAFLITLLIGVPCLAQCPPGSPSCPSPNRKAEPIYRFDRASSNPAPWETVVRITAMVGTSRFSGSGTVIDGSPRACLVMTCAHIMRGNPKLSVEIFGPGLNSSTGSVGDPIARFDAVAIDFNEAKDVGLIRFEPPYAIPASPLVPPGWSPQKAVYLVSLGCNRGQNPTAYCERFTEVKTLVIGKNPVPYDGIVCDRKPIEGRSGGGLYDEKGQLAAVCDFASLNSDQGYYASTESLRKILRANGLVELADGMTRKPPHAADPIRSIENDAVEGFEKEAANLTLPLLACGGMGATGVLAGLFALFKRGKPSQPVPVVSSAGYSPSPEDLTRLLVNALKDREEKEVKQKSDAELLDQIKALVSQPKPSPPNA
jgi:hypothetical protein